MTIRSLLAALACWCVLLTAEAQTVQRSIVVTLDDLPAVSVIGSEKAMTAKLLRSLRELQVPAIGFVNEGTLFAPGEPAPDPERLALLDQWLDAGFELGNHTYSHRSLHKISAQEYAADIERGEVLTRPLMASRKMQLRYFRHPYLHTGTDLEARMAIELVLSKRGYQVAPVTVENGDYLFAAAYARADASTQQRIAAEYIRYMDAMLDYYEKQSVALFGREIPQVLLLHANQINADRFGELARMMQARGYRFVSLQTALADPAYRSPDLYMGAGGISWLHRWALSTGKNAAIVPGEPTVPTWITP